MINYRIPTVNRRNQREPALPLFQGIPTKDSSSTIALLFETGPLRDSNKKRIVARTNEMVTGKAKRRNRAKAYLQRYVESDFASITKSGGIAAVRSRFAFC